MIVKSLGLKNFRNHIDTDILFSDSFNIIYGDNGQGKTNILEAIYLCATGRSHRTSKDSELIRFGSTAFNINTSVSLGELEKNISIDYLMNQKKQIKINEIPIKKIGSLLGNLYAVFFSPEDLFIIKQGPMERRRFADITLSQIRPSYFYNLQIFSKILKQRNMLLKNIVSKAELYDTIDIWNTKLSEVAANIIVERQHFANVLSDLAQGQHKIISSDKEMILFKYNCSFQLFNTNEKCQIIQLYLKHLEKNISRDIAVGYTTIGPHRDDYEILINDKSLKTYGSQGQQRSAVLSLKIAEIELIRNETNQLPILLLDDVMSELDENRQKYLMYGINNIQTFITCTSISQYQSLKSDMVKFFKVQNGKVIDYCEK